jgi:hypothetical protein
VVRLAGRHECECQAVKHGLVSNCLGCGRIVCSQEGSGPCLFCGSLVVTREEQVVLDRKSKKSEELYKKLAETQFPPRPQDHLRLRRPEGGGGGGAGGAGHGAAGSLQERRLLRGR